MDRRITWLAPPPQTPPSTLRHPFDEGAPHPLARAAAEQLQAELRVDPRRFEKDGGKMFGVLVVEAADGRVGWLKAFSGQLTGRWNVEGFVPPMFDVKARDAVEVPGEAAIQRLIARRKAHEQSDTLLSARRDVEELETRQATARSEMRLRHQANRRQRKQRRLDPSENEAALAQESRKDKAERRFHDERDERALASLRARLRREERRLGALDRLRRIVSRRLMKRIHDSYDVVNARGERRSLRTLYAPDEPPAGAGDCAAPKLFAHAFRNGLRPLALAEFWWGEAPAGGGRVSGVYYPACRNKCGPLLPFMLEGLDVAQEKTPHRPTRSLVMETIYEDDRIIVFSKPAGLLSVPGRGAHGADSVLSRMKSGHPDATGALIVHRLDLDTSGVMVAALDPRAHAFLQGQFARREVEKRYVAWLDGEVVSDHGRIEWAMRKDFEDKPRQIYDPVHGKLAITDWRVLERREGRTRVEFFPRTGRTHQLRVHASHRLGLGAAIVGDRLYGKAAERMLLHADRVAFRHPTTGETMSFESPADF